LRIIVAYLEREALIQPVCLIFVRCTNRFLYIHNNALRIGRPHFDIAVKIEDLNRRTGRNCRFLMFIKGKVVSRDVPEIQIAYLENVSDIGTDVRGRRNGTSKEEDRKSTRLNSSHQIISYAV